MPVRRSEGRIHPISQVMDEMIAIFADMGFAVAEGPDIEDRLPQFHRAELSAEASGARDARHLLLQAGRRTASASCCAPTPRRCRSAPWRAQKPPIRIIAPGRTYRCDTDQTHTPMFHQVEGLVIDEHTHMGHLKWMLEEFCKAFFEVDRRARCASARTISPSPSRRSRSTSAATARGDEIRIGEGDDWLEILGCGMVHPNVLRNCGLDPDEYQGFAFGMGIDRLAMLKYGMPDLRAFFDADLRWLSHYGFRRSTCPASHGGLTPMKFTLSWLKDHLDTDATRRRDRRHADHDRPRGRGVDDPAATLDALHRRPACSRPSSIPNADKLQVCTVDTGDGRPVQVVCGAPNARAGMIGVFAPPGTYVPGTGIDLQAGIDPRRRIATACCARRASWTCPTTTTASSTCRRRAGRRPYAA